MADDPNGNVQHIAHHGFTVDEVEEVIRSPRSRIVTGHPSGNPSFIGKTKAGRLLNVPFRLEDADTVYPITAFDYP